MNVIVACDTTWDNFALISKRLTSKNIDPIHRINIFYGKQLKHISTLCNRNMLQVFRNCINTKTFLNDLCIQLRFAKFCIIFHNFTEYNTISTILIELCKENEIPYFIFSEHTDDFFFNGEPASTKFKNCTKSIQDNQNREIIHCNMQFELSFATATTKLKEYSQIVQKLRNSYSCIDENKGKKSIVFIDNKTHKQYSYIEYMTNKKKWLKDVIPK